MMSLDHWLIVPILLPALMGAHLIAFCRHDLLLQRVFGLAGSVVLLAVALGLGWAAWDGSVHVYRLGNWQAPFGIVLVLDRLAALMLVLTAVLALTVQLYGVGSGWDRKGWHFHALWMFQMMGVNGAFLTGDAFNLFVFFEVLLIASYGLMIHGGGALRLRAGVQYVVYNLAGSTLFLASLGAIYASTGTLNMADLAEKVATMPPDQTAILRVGAVLMLLVFAIKAALVPLHLWLPSTYANAPGPSSALFAILSKVGIYAIIRFFTLVFPQDTVVETIAIDLLMPAALATLILGQIGVLGTASLTRLAAFAAIASIGTLMIGVARFQPEAMTAALYYMLHSTLAAAALFLVVDAVAARRGGDVWLRVRGPVAQDGLVGALFLAAAIAMVGLPPLSGFLGKLLILSATAGDPWAVAIWASVLVTSAMALVGFARAGSTVFWKAHALPAIRAPLAPTPPRGDAAIPTKLETDEAIQDVGDSASPALALAAIGALLAMLGLLAVLAGPATAVLDRVTAQMFDPAVYIDAVLRQQAEARP